MKPEIIRKNSNYLNNPASLIAASRGRRAVLLHSGGPSSEYSRYSIFCRDPYMTFRAIDGATTISTSAETRQYNTDPFDLLAEIMQTEGISLSPSDSDTALPFQCGIVGYIGYEAGNYIEKLPSKKENAIGLPDIYLCFYRASYVMNHQTKTAWVLGNDKEAVDELHDFISDLDQAVIPTLNTSFTTIEKAHKHFKSTFTYEEYIRAVERTLEYIVAGDIFQANITHRFESKFDHDPAVLFDLLNRNNYSANAGNTLSLHLTLKGLTNLKFFIRSYSENKPLHLKTLKISVRTTTYTL